MIPKKSFEESKQKALYLAKAAIGKKGFHVIILEIGLVNPFTDCFLLISGHSDRHVQAIADELHEDLEGIGGGVLGMEGYEEGKWVLIDAGDVVIHIFQETTRKYYDLEGLWIDAPRVRVDEDGISGEKEVIGC